jgi:hypothetical protein
MVYSSEDEYPISRWIFHYCGAEKGDHHHSRDWAGKITFVLISLAAL